MAKVDRSKADYKIIKKVIGKKLQYSSLSSEDKTKIKEELLKTTNYFCPFTGAWFPKERDWTIEHFYPKSIAEYKHLQLEWTNLFHCIGDANLSEIRYRQDWDPPNVYSPEEIDYLDVLTCDTFYFEIKPMNLDDQQAINTIARYNLNSKSKKQARESWFADRYKFQNEDYPFCEYFRTES